MTSEITHSQYLELKNKIDKTGQLSAMVASDSMTPVINENDTVTIVPVTNELRPFDIVVFYANHKLVCHTVIKESAFTTDSLNRNYLFGSYKYSQFDAPVAENIILGRVTSHKLKLHQKIWLILRLYFKN